MVFDPFEDFHTRGYLQNHAGTKDAAIVSRLEHNAFAGNVLNALSSLAQRNEIDIEAVQETHRILFQDVYPWAGEDRSQNAASLNITKGDVEFQFAPFVQQGLAHSLNNALDAKVFRDDPGKVIGELAYAHPFLEGNGRTITVVMSELTRRAGFHIAWEETSKASYLTALTAELNDPDKGHLTNYLKPYIRDGAIGIEHSASVLNEVPGLNRPEVNINTDERPVLSIIAGPIGSGKSTFISGSDGLVGEVIRLEQLGDVDHRAFDKSMELVSREQSFVLETDVTHSTVAELVEVAKANGYRTKLTFIGVVSPELAMARASDQYLEIDDDVLNNNWKQSLSGSGVIIDLVDDTTLLDNSTNEGFRAVAQLTSVNYTFSDAPEWATDAALSAAQVQLENASDVSQLDKATELAVSAARAGGVDEAHVQELTTSPSQVSKRSLKDDGYDL